MIRKWETPLCTPPAYILASPCFFCACLYTPLRCSFLQHIQTCNLNGIRLSQTYDSEPFSSLKTIFWIKSLVMVTTHGKTHDFPISSPRGFSSFVFNAPLEQTWTLSIKSFIKQIPGNRFSGKFSTFWALAKFFPELTASMHHLHPFLAVYFAGHRGLAFVHPWGIVRVLSWGRLR